MNGDRKSLPYSFLVAVFTYSVQARPVTSLQDY